MNSGGDVYCEQRNEKGNSLAWLKVWTKWKEVVEWLALKYCNVSVCMYVCELRVYKRRETRKQNKTKKKPLF